jgi:hypothetical protein
LVKKCASIIILLCLIFDLLGCTSMRYISRKEIPELEQETDLWVTLIDGTQFVMKKPKVEGSKLVGYVGGKYEEIDFLKIEKLGIKVPDKEKTTTLVIISSLFIVVAILIQFADEEGYFVGRHETDDSIPCGT